MHKSPTLQVGRGAGRRGGKSEGENMSPHHSQGISSPRRQTRYALFLDLAIGLGIPFLQLVGGECTQAFEARQRLTRCPRAHRVWYVTLVGAPPRIPVHCDAHRS